MILLHLDDYTAASHLLSLSLSFSLNLRMSLTLSSECLVSMFKK